MCLISFNFIKNLLKKYNYSNLLLIIENKKDNFTQTKNNFIDDEYDIINYNTDEKINIIIDNYKIN